MTSHRSPLRDLVLAALFLALGLMLPFLTAQIPEIGNMLLPMHIPVLLCGFVLGWKWGLAVGFITPLFRTLLFSMPPLLTALPMAFELAAYGILTGLLYHLFRRKPVSVYLTLILAMLGGRLVWGAARFVMFFFGTEFSLPLFIAGAFTNALPGMILQLVLIPPLVLALRRLKVMD